MGSFSAAELVGLPVRLREVRLGRVVDLVLDPAARRVVGFVVDCGDETPRFLPFAASQPSENEIAVASALMLLDDVGFYRKHGVSFRELLEARDRAAGMLVAPNGDVVELETAA
jgi:PRC-barrel domain protein